MTLKLKGIKIVIPDGASVSVSEDGTEVEISGVPVAEPTVIEMIRIVEVEGPERIVYQNWPTYTQPYNPQIPYNPWGPNPNWIYTGMTHPDCVPITTTGPLEPFDGSYTVTGGLSSGQVSTTEGIGFPSVTTVGWTGDLVTDLNGQVIGSTLSGWTGIN